MKNEKGFTLVELLAIIVILAIIALIATPIILNTIENSRKGSAQDSAWATIEATKLAYAEYLATNAAASPNSSVSFNSEGKGCVAGNVSSGCVSVNLSGTKPRGGTLTLDSNTGDYTISTSYPLKFSIQGSTYNCSQSGTTITCTKQTS